MYLPLRFKNQDEKKIKQIIEDNPFATVLSYPQGQDIFINHLPLFLFESASSEAMILVGHMAKNNPQWQQFKKNNKATIIIHGPHTYITPQWYPDEKGVPTWNYVAIHLNGHIEILETPESQAEILSFMSKKLEGENYKKINSNHQLLLEIVSFKFYLEKKDAKFKLSQNQTEENRQGVIRGLRKRKDDMSAKILQLMMEEE